MNSNTDQFSRSVVSDSLPPHGMQQARPPVHHQLPGPAQTHVHWVSDAIQPSHPLLSPSPPAFDLSQHQGVFKWVSSWHQVAKLLEFQLQHQSFQWIFRVDFQSPQGTLKSLLQHHSSKAPVPQCSPLSHLVTPSSDWLSWYCSAYVHVTLTLLVSLIMTSKHKNSHAGSSDMPKRSCKVFPLSKELLKVLGLIIFSYQDLQ